MWIGIFAEQCFFNRKIVSFQIVIPSSSNKNLLFSHQSKHHFNAHLHKQCGLAVLLSDASLIENFPSFQNSIASGSDKNLLG